jgi:hypothetical protein
MVRAWWQRRFRELGALRADRSNELGRWQLTSFLNEQSALWLQNNAIYCIMFVQVCCGWKNVAHTGLKGHGLEHLPILMHIVLCGKRFRCACCLHRSILCKCTTGCEIQHLLTITDRNGWFLRNTCYTYIYNYILYTYMYNIYIYVYIYIWCIYRCWLSYMFSMYFQHQDLP